MQINAGLEIIISTSAKYRELNAVRYNADENTIMLEFALLGAADLEPVLKYIANGLDTYQHLFSQASRLTRITLTESLGISLLRVTRDVDTVSEEEIDLLVDLIRTHLADRIIVNDDQEIGQERLKKRLTNKLLKRVNNSDIGAMNFSIFREEGKIFILNNIREVSN
jgi:hypothetical protein